MVQLLASVPNSGACAYPALSFTPSFSSCFRGTRSGLKQTIPVHLPDIVETETKHFADAKH